MNANQTAGASWTERLTKQTFKLAAWTAAWAGSLKLATFGAESLWSGNRLLSAFAISVNLVIGLGLIRAHRDYLRSLDEMQRRIFLESMGLALGIGVVAGCAYAALDMTNVIAGNATIGTLLIVMGLTYLGAVIYGNWKYR
jgi:hypothetical protein